MLILNDCQLDLAFSILTISPNSPDEFNSTTVDLDEFVGNIGGELVWAGGAVKFTESSTNIRLEGQFLVAMCSVGSDDSGVVEAKLDLDEHIAYVPARRYFVAVTPDPAFSELMSSTNWMNFTVVTQPDMRRFLAHPAFQAAISGVARRAVEEVMNQMKAVMAEAVEQAVMQVSAQSQEYVQNEMETLIKKATKTAAYAGLGQLKLMETHQKRAYNRFAPTIAGPTLHERTDTSFEYSATQ
ncbi:hypothetical protein C8J57DRAFT_1534513 [Mycena rebaudengoi]|nr:hypothetical protein C8J57DRAFT_1534513 [Mycena rebaudengoi]